MPNEIIVPELDMQRLEMQAVNQLSNFEGDAYEGEDFADFEGDDFHGKVIALPKEANPKRIFTFSVNNSNPTFEKFFLSKSYEAYAELVMQMRGYTGFPAGYNPLAGQMFEGQFPSIAGNNLTASGSPTYIDKFLAFVHENPCRVVAMKIDSASADNHAQVIEIEQKSPFRKFGSSNVNISLYKDEYQNNAFISSIREGFDLNNQSSVQFTIAPNSTMTVMLVVGGVKNIAKELAVKARKRQPKTIGK